ncbi:MFS transporter [Paraburkholderia youngii]|uniref:Putative MFS family arabinose efflux permease n=1 Tax=Paraburkholderia youngii TaxID=2782701 RepID=A0A7W8LFH4_9BURK|nr:MFS transporter [Paraburkholderia youngii]MBB5404679.1 putative MFS family arabinose efflux permease [Paraburkholderia youngii]
MSQTTSVQPQRTRNWLAVVSVALSATVFCTTEFLPVGLLRYISQGLGVSEGTAGIMVTAPGLLAAIAAPFLTVAVGRFDRRRVLLGLGLLLVISNLTAMLAPNFTILVAARALFGFGIGGFWAISVGLGARLVPEKHVGRATSLIFAGVSLGMLIGGPAGALIGDLAGWRAAFGAALALSVAALLAQWVSLPSLHVEHRVSTRDLLGIFGTRPARIGLIAMTLALCGQFATYTYITPFLATVSGFGGKVISLLLLGYTFIGLLGNFIGGSSAQRNVRTTLIASILFIALPLAMLPALSTSRPSVLVALAAWGTAYGAMPVALQMWMAQATREVREGGMALFVANFQISIALGSFVGGRIVDGFGLFNAMYFGAGLAVVSILTLALTGGHPRRIDEPATT